MIDSIRLYKEYLIQLPGRVCINEEIYFDIVKYIANFVSNNKPAFPWSSIDITLISR